MKPYLFEKSINIYYEIGSNSKHTARHYFLDINKDLLIFLSGCVNENRKSLCKTYIDILNLYEFVLSLILIWSLFWLLWKKYRFSVYEKITLKIINWRVVKHSYLVLFLKFSNSWSKSVQRVPTLGIQWRKHVVLVGVWGNKEGRQPGGGRGKS